MLLHSTRKLNQKSHPKGQALQSSRNYSQNSQGLKMHKSKPDKTRINRTKNKSHMVFSVDAGRTFVKIQHLLHDKKRKTAQQTNLEGTYHNIKRIYMIIQQPISY